MIVSKKTLWAGRILSAVVALLILFAAVPKLLGVAAVVDGFRQAGYPASAVPIVGMVELACAALYLLPRTRFLGAILMTGLLGGATATNVRLGDPTWVVPALLGVVAWAGLFFRDARLRALIPLRG